MRLRTLVAEGNIYSICEEVAESLKNSDPQKILEILIDGMHLAGERFEKGEFFLPELLRAAETFREAMEVLEPVLGDNVSQRLGKIVLGTVRGDVHDLGKNLVAVMLEGGGFEVVDLGIDIAADVFVAAVREHQPHIVGMSALLTTTMLEMEGTIKALEQAGQRGAVGVLVGGAPVSERFAREIGADAYASNAVGAVKKAIALIEKPQ